VEIPKEPEVALYVASIGEEAYAKAFSIVSELRKKGLKCECDHMKRGIKSQFKYADKIGSKYVLTIGENELISGEATLKKMEDGSEKTVKFEDIYNNIV
ncbi:MAG: histidine--tRNA ligase, partial [Clostridia bacterium]|nr:histidine--tRNA ligase [Clostridia bacterium]